MTKASNPVCPGEGWNKLMLFVASLLVAVSIFLPYWRIEIVAPQYPEGLYVYVHVTGARGDVREVDGLNHYIGMRPLDEAAPFERKISVPGLSLIALALLGSIFVRRPRWLQVVLVLPVLAVLVVFPADLYYWLREFGLNLDPHAPLSAMVKPFVPPVLGPGKIAQFGVVSWPWYGYGLVALASVLAVWATVRRVRCVRAGEKMLSAVPAKPVVGIALAMLLFGCALPVEAREWRVPADGSLSLKEAIAQAQPGDTIRVIGGVHTGQWVVDKPLYLLGEHAPILDGGGVGSVLTLKSPRCVVRGFVIRNSGIVLNNQDSGISVKAPDCLIEDNRLEKVLFGVHLDKAHRTVVRRNRIFSHALPIARRGDMAHQSVKVFDLLASQNSALRLLSYSPSAQALDFGARLFPMFAPRPLVRDESPLMHPSPMPFAGARQETLWGWLVFSAFSLAFGVIGVARPRMRAKHRVKAFTGERAVKGRLGRTVVRVSGLTRRFGAVRAVDSVSFVVREGETVALWGANGAGKTTILRCLLGLLRFEGEAEVLGYSVVRESLAVRQRVGYVPQLIHLHSDLSVRETAHFYARLRAVPAERVERLLQAWDLEPHAEKPIRALSGGLKQKLALVLALLSDPPILLLDEPTAHLDTSARAEWLELLRRLKAEGKTLVFCTHQFAEVRALADRVIVLEHGRKVADLTATDFVSLWLERGSLRVLVPPEEAERAGQILRSAGYQAESADGLVVVHHLSSNRVEPLKLLLDAGITVLDYEWRAPIESPRWEQIPEAVRFTKVEENGTVARADSRLRLPSWWEKVRLLTDKEIRDLRRNRWFLLLAGIFTALSVILTAFGLTGTGSAGGGAGYGRTFASLLNLSLLIVPLIGLIVGAISVSSERDQQTLYTLLSHPISGTDIVWGKFLGGMVLLGSAVLIGFGSSGLLLFMGGADLPVARFVGQMALTLFLGWVCLALGLVVSVLVHRGATAVGITLLMWLGLVFFSDLGIIGTALALQLKAQTLLGLTFLNPLQVFKIAVIQLMEGNLEVLGSAGLYARDRFGDSILWIGVGTLLMWVASLFAFAWLWFAERGVRE